MTECGLCGAAMTGPECHVCGWRASTAAVQNSAPVTPAASSPSPPPPPAPASASAPAPRPPRMDNGAAASGSKSRAAWVLGGMLAAALVVGIVAVGMSLSGRPSGSPAAQQSTGTTNGPGTSPSLNGSAPPELANSVPDTPKLNGWITVLESIPQSGGELSHARSVANNLHQQYGADIYVIDSGDYKGLNSGWWAVVMIGFDTNAEARAACSSVGRSPSGSCYGRRVKG